eukprot:TRINITY_DN4474_c0_g2_i1.p1 TRINITY_DN4474_c0_g2~~TRINITY_DN4474_c0_g2_i1.p1  ORF type:complete len:704 (-),score=148.49 TRINITY_DN4474_c0_g2_i1:97-2208(-)
MKREKKISEETIEGASEEDEIKEDSREESQRETPEEANETDAPRDKTNGLDNEKKIGKSKYDDSIDYETSREHSSRKHGSKRHRSHRKDDKDRHERRHRKHRHDRERSGKDNKGRRNDRDHERDRDRDRDRDRVRDRGWRDRTCESEKERDRERERPMDRERERERDRNRERDSSKQWDCDRDREHDRLRGERDRNERNGKYDESYGGYKESSKKRKVEEASSKSQEEGKVLPDANGETTADELERIRLERIERWKKIKTQQPQSMPSPSQDSTIIPMQNDDTSQADGGVAKGAEGKDEMEKVDAPSGEMGMVSRLVKERENELITKEEDDFQLDMFNEVDEDHDLFSEDTSIKAFKRVEMEPSDDHEGYYSFRLGEILGGKYVVVGYHGKGVFSNVLKCQEVTTEKEVAIKLLRNNDHMKRTGKKEVRILRQLRDSDPDCKYNNIHLFADFEDRDHLCLVFEPMDLNLRQLLRRYGGRGISLVAVRFYASKLLRALVHLYNNGIIHADVKPDNILINKDRTVVKLADLGSALELSEVEPTPFLVSRFYRAPEIILGIDYNQGIDMFSLGTCLFELATGKPMLRSTDNNHHLKLIQEMKGSISRRILQRARFREYFDESLNYFLETVPDPVDRQKEIVRKVRFEKPSRDITKELINSYTATESREKRHVSLLGELISKATEVDQERRLTPQQALKHEIFKELV